MIFPVFDDIFTNMKEDQENHMVIDDIDAEVFKELLHYIYTSEINDWEKVTLHLAQAAEKYKIEELVKICHLYVKVNMECKHVMFLSNHGMFESNNVPVINNIVAAAVKFVIKNKSQFSDEDLQVLCGDPHFTRLLLNEVAGGNARGMRPTITLPG